MQAKDLFYAIDIFVPMCFCFLGNLAFLKSAGIS